MFARSFLCLLGMAAPAWAQPAVTALSFTPDQSQLVVGSQAGIEIKSWPEMKTISRLDADLKHINDAVFSPNGKVLLVAGGSPSEYGELAAFAWPTGTPLFSTVQHDDVIYSAAWLDDHRCVTGAADSLAAVWKLGKNELTRERQLLGHSRRVLAVNYLASHQLLLTTGIDQSIRVWDQEKLVRVLDNHTGIVRDIKIRPGEYALPYIATASEDRTVRLWQPTIGRMVRFARLAAEPLAIAWSAEGDKIAVACNDGALRIVDPNTVRIETELDVLNGWAYEVIAAPDGSFVVGGTHGQLVRVAIED